MLETASLIELVGPGPVQSQRVFLSVSWRRSVRFKIALIVRPRQDRTGEDRTGQIWTGFSEALSLALPQEVCVVRCVPVPVAVAEAATGSGDSLCRF